MLEANKKKLATDTFVQHSKAELIKSNEKKKLPDRNQPADPKQTHHPVCKHENFKQENKSFSFLLSLSLSLSCARNFLQQLLPRFISSMTPQH
jgi:hypothetical protein